MIKFKAGLTISRVSGPDGDYIAVAIDDADASLREVVKIELSLEEYARAITGICSRPGKGVVREKQLRHIGKKMEHKSLVFELTQDAYRNKDMAKMMAADVCPEGWEPDLYFGSQESFFCKGRKNFARTTIRRWVEKEAEK